MYASDYGYANNSDDWDVGMYHYYEISSNNGSRDNWMYDNNVSFEWTLTPDLNSSKVLEKYVVGWVNSRAADFNAGGTVSPVLHLKPSVEFISGDGSKGNPYRLG